MPPKTAICSILTIVAGVVVTQSSAIAAVHVSNAARSRADAYNQVNQMIAISQSQQITDENSLPVRVADTDLARKLIQGDTSIHVTFTDLNNCKETYPAAEFAWDKPNVGLSSNKSDQCVGVVRMYGYQMGPGGSDALLATANLPIDGSIKCNISEFPESGYTTYAGQVTFPADNEPTMDDVKRAMNRESKQNAGLKIAAMALTGGVIGNMVGNNPENPGNIFGSNKEKVHSTAIGATSGAALAAASAYSGKVAGDAILNAGIAAAGGGIVANISASTNPDSNKLRIEKCTIDGKDTTCLWGYLIITDEKHANAAMFYNVNLHESYVCEDNLTKCTTTSLHEPIFEYDNKEIYAETLNPENLKTVNGLARYRNYTDTNDSNCNGLFSCFMETTDNLSIPGDKKFINNETIIVKLTKGSAIDTKIPAMIEYKGGNTFFGKSKNDWLKTEKKKFIDNNAQVYGRLANGLQGTLIANNATPKKPIESFEPMTIGADDDHGNIIDLSNKARLGATIKGAAVAATEAAGAGVAQANKEISERYVSAVAEYNGSLQKIYCKSGERYLGKYNDIVEIPKIQQ
ncbi:MAG: hypothetical protein MJ187_01655 [Alphaproteobacteria bacterium]|nr:hypothetical protein [Alphaproteobacteria bacterium]